MLGAGALRSVDLVIIFFFSLYQELHALERASTKSPRMKMKGSLLVTGHSSRIESLTSTKIPLPFFEPHPFSPASVPSDAPKK